MGLSGVGGIRLGRGGGGGGGWRAHLLSFSRINKQILWDKSNCNSSLRLEKSY